MSLSLVLGLLAVPALLACGYLFLLTLLSGRPPAPLAPATGPRFDIVVPAHDEEAGIGRTVESLLGLDWPRERFRVLVVADNCQDRTAEQAAAAGATVLVRNDPERRGKGYALELAFQRALSDGLADAVVVVDADTVASSGLLRAFASRLTMGAHAVQARYGVLNPDASWRTRLMTIAFALVNDLRSLGRERLRVSCGLRGNGMCFSAEALRRVPYRAFSIVEDLEHGIHLAEAGIRVHYAGEAAVLGEMVSGEKASRSQRLRWEGGRSAFARSQAPLLVARGLRRREPVLLDLGFDLLVPALSWVGAYVVLGAAAAGVVAWVHPGQAGALGPWLVSCAFLGCYLLRGLWLSGMGLRGAAALAWAPFYLFWKVGLLLRHRRRSGEWVRTERERAPPG